MTRSFLVATEGEIPLGTSKLVEVHGQPIAVFHTSLGWYAIEDRCSHRGGPLSEGTCDQKSVFCPWHKAQFDLISGECLSSPKRKSLKTYPVVITGNKVQIEFSLEAI